MLLRINSSATYHNIPYVPIAGWNRLMAVLRLDAFSKAVRGGALDGNRPEHIPKSISQSAQHSQLFRS